MPSSSLCRAFSRSAVRICAAGADAVFGAVQRQSQLGLEVAGAAGPVGGTLLLVVAKAAWAALGTATVGQKLRAYRA